MAIFVPETGGGVYSLGTFTITNDQVNITATQLKELCSEYNFLLVVVDIGGNSAFGGKRTQNTIIESNLLPYNSSSMSDSLQSEIYYENTAYQFCINTKGGTYEATEGYVGFYWGRGATVPVFPVVGVRFYGIK